MKALKIIGIVVLFLVLLATGLFYLIFHDNCNDEPTFKSVEANIEYQDEDSSLNIKVKWVPQIDLPLAYYKEVELLTTEDEIEIWGFKSDRELLDTVIVDHDSQITVALNESPQHFELTLGFPDRRDYYNCSHPGRSDQYILNLRMNIDYAPNRPPQLKKFKWQEVANLGGM